MESTQKENGPPETWIALLGRKDMPTDGLADYCSYLGQNLAGHGIELRPDRVEWSRDGWLRALRDLSRRSKAWRGMWVLPQYTSLGWSQRGFPLGALACAIVLWLRGARCAMVFHDPWGLSGPRAIDRIRGAFQNWTIRTLHRFAEKSIFTIPLHTVHWLPEDDSKSVSILLGANIPENLTTRAARQDNDGAPKTIVVFCLSQSPHGEREVNDVASAMRIAASGVDRLRVVFVGRGTAEMKSEIDRAFAGSQIEVCNHGLRPAPEVTRIFSEADAMIAVRGKLYLRRASALAGLACGLPIVGYSGGAAGTILEEAGITLVPFRDYQALGSALRDILTNSDLWQEMHEKNLLIQQKYFSWNVIAADFVRRLGHRKG
jgi:glycosyltransferase involved in cell wall biosynthesis